jgi:hypothetical protein
MLFYIGAYSHKEIAEFLGIPISTVKMRLFHARSRLRSELEEIEQALQPHRPSRDHTFVEKTVSFEVLSKDIPAQQVMSANRDTFISDLQAHLDGSIKTLMVYAQASAAQISGLPLAIYRGAVREDRHAQVEICLPVTGQLRATIEIAVKELPAARGAGYLRRVISKDNDVTIAVNTDNLTNFEETVFADADCTASTLWAAPRSSCRKASANCWTSSTTA